MVSGVAVDVVIVMLTLAVMIIGADDFYRRVSTVLLFFSGIHSICFASRNDAEIAWHMESAIRASIVSAIGQIVLSIVLITAAADTDGAIKRLAITIVVLASVKFLTMAFVSFVYPTFFDPPADLADNGYYQRATGDGSPLDPDIWSDEPTPNSAVVAYQLADRPPDGSFARSPFS
jgi:cytochrome bd-type quinol oxidase subunit 2